MSRLLLILAIATTLFCSCATSPDPREQRLQTLRQRYAQFDVIMAWDTKVADGKTIIDGVVKNVRYTSMYDLEVRVAALDDAGKVRAKGVSLIIPRKLDMNEAADFSVKLPVAVEPGTRLRFTYLYRGSEGDEGFAGGLERGPNWMQSFEATVPAR